MSQPAAGSESVDTEAGGSPSTRNRWLSGLELLLFLFPPLVGVGLIAVLREVYLPVISELVVVVSAVGYLVLAVGVPLCIYGDAWWLRTQSARRRRWQPTVWLYVLPAVVWPPLVGVVYLAVRHSRHPPTGTDSGWWVALAVGLGAYTVGVGLSLVGATFGLPRLLLAGIALAGTIAYGVFPAAIYRDSCYAHTQSTGWQPNPGVYLGWAFLSLFVALLQPLVAGYYLLRRQQAVGTP